MLKKVPDIEQPFRPYDELFAPCFVNYEGGYIQKIEGGTIPNGLIDCIFQITLERDVFFGHDTMLLTAGHDYNEFGQERVVSEPVGGPITVHQGVWIGTRAIILGPCEIGEHSVIGAGSVVTVDNVPAY